MNYRTHDKKRPCIVCCTTTEVVELEIRAVTEKQEDIKEKFESTTAKEEGGEESVDVKFGDDPGPE